MGSYICLVGRLGERGCNFLLVVLFFVFTEIKKCDTDWVAFFLLIGSYSRDSYWKFIPIRIDFKKYKFRILYFGRIALAI